jgi:hypothetical protein
VLIIVLRILSSVFLKAACYTGYFERLFLCQKLKIYCTPSPSLHNIVAYLLKVRTVEPEKQPLLSNGSVTRNNGVTGGSGVFCAVRTEAI